MKLLTVRPEERRIAPHEIRDDDLAAVERAAVREPTHVNRECAVWDQPLAQGYAQDEPHDDRGQPVGE